MNLELKYPDHLTQHAIQRYRERVEDVSPAVVWERLTTPFILSAIKAGVKSIKLPTGHSARVEGGKIVTVTHKEQEYNRSGKHKFLAQRRGYRHGRR